MLEEIGFSGFSLSDSASFAERVDLIATVGLVGGVKGHFIIRIGADSALGFVRTLSAHLGMHQENPEDNGYRKAAIAEFANQVGGRATVLFEESGIECSITPPTLISGEGVETFSPESDQKYTFSVQGAFGEFMCGVDIKSAKTI